MISMEFVIDPEVIEREYEDKKKDIEGAVMSTAVEIRDRARYHLTSTPYRMDKIARNGIVYGRLKKDGETSSSKVHAFGVKDDGSLARIFVRGTVGRNNGRRYTGYIKPTPAIDQALDQNLLDNNIQKTL